MRSGVFFLCAMLVVLAFSGCISDSGDIDEPRQPGFHTSMLRITPNGEARFWANSNLSVVVTEMYDERAVTYWDQVWVEIDQGGSHGIDNVERIHPWNGTKATSLTGWYIKGEGVEQDQVEVGDTLLITSYDKDESGIMDGDFNIMLRVDDPDGVGTYNRTLSSHNFAPAFLHFKPISFQKRPGTGVWDADFRLENSDPYERAFGLDNLTVRIEEGPGEELVQMKREYPFVTFENRTHTDLVYYHQRAGTNSLNMGDLFTVAGLTKEYEGGCVFVMWWDNQFGAFPLPESFA